MNEGEWLMKDIEVSWIKRMAKFANINANLTQVILTYLISNVSSLSLS